jgi:hypothetical protein
MHPSHHAPGHWSQLCSPASATPLYRPSRRISQAALSAQLTRIGQVAVSATPSGQTVAAAHKYRPQCCIATLSYWPCCRLGRAVIGGGWPLLSLGLLNNQPQLLATRPNYSPYSFDAKDDTLLVAVVDADDTLAAQHPNYYSSSQRDTDNEQTTINPSYFSPNHCWFPV